MKGKWTVPGDPVPSSHLLTAGGSVLIATRCGRLFGPPKADPTDDVPATGKTCESCLRLSRRDS